MVASKSLLVALAVVAVVGIARAHEFDKDTRDCIKLLSDGLVGVSIPPEVEKFVQLVHSTLPGVIPERFELISRDSRVQSLEAANPLEQCKNFTDQVDEFSTKTVQNNDLCMRIFSDDETGNAIFAYGRQHSVLGPLFEANEACMIFSPLRDAQ